MKQNFYFKHDAPSATNPTLAKLLQKEGARGYGVYWLLIELLRLQTDFSLPVTETAGLVSRLGYTQKTVVVRVIENYDLFSEENGMFFSVGLIKRMENFLSKRDEMSKELGGSLEDNALIINSRFLHNARKEEQRREEQENNSLTRERVRGVLSMDEAIALLPSEPVWCEDMARLSGRGVEFAADLPQLLPSFTAFLRLRGEEHTVTGLSDAKRAAGGEATANYGRCRRRKRSLPLRDAGRRAAHLYGTPHSGRCTATPQLMGGVGRPDGGMDTLSTVLASAGNGA